MGSGREHQQQDLHCCRARRRRRPQGSDLLPLPLPLILLLLILLLALTRASWVPSSSMSCHSVSVSGVGVEIVTQRVHSSGEHGLRKRKGNDDDEEEEKEEDEKEGSRSQMHISECSLIHADAAQQSFDPLSRSLLQMSWSTSMSTGETGTLGQGKSIRSISSSRDRRSV